MKKLTILLLTVLFVSPCWAENETLYIGLDADMSAVAVSGGLAIQRGAEIAIHEINEQGGLLGKKLVLLTKDHRGNPARGMANIEAFSKQNNLLAVLGGVHTPVALKELPLIHQHKLIYLNPWAAGTSIVDNHYQPNYVFRVSVRDAEAGKVFINYAKSLGLNKIGLLLEQTAWGRSNEKSVNSQAILSGLNVVATEWVNWGQTDVTDEVNSLKQAGAETIIMVVNAPEGTKIVKQIMTDPELTSLPLISHWGLASGEFVKKVGLDTLNKLNLTVLQTYSFEAPTNPAVNERVISLYQDLFDPKVSARTIPSAVGVAHAYDLIHLLAIAVKNANSEDREKIQAALEKISRYDGLVKTYLPPFSKQQHDALFADDYTMSRFDQSGWLVPVTDKLAEVSND